MMTNMPDSNPDDPSVSDPPDRSSESSRVMITPDEATAKTETDDAKAEPTICLDQFLKTCGVATGGQAKQLIQGGEVLLNQEVETRRRKKLRHGDEVQLFDEVYVVQFDQSDNESSGE